MVFNIKHSIKGQHIPDACIVMDQGITEEKRRPKKKIKSVYNILKSVCFNLQYPSISRSLNPTCLFLCRYITTPSLLQQQFILIYSIMHCLQW